MASQCSEMEGGEIGASQVSMRSSGAVNAAQRGNFGEVQTIRLESSAECSSGHACQEATQDLPKKHPEGTEEHLRSSLRAGNSFVATSKSGKAV